MAATALATTPELRLVELWNRTDRIFGLLAAHAWLERPIALRHPFIFYVGHLPAFAWNYLGDAAGGDRDRPRRDADFDELFSRGIDPDVDDPSRCHAHPDVPERWPSIADVLAYRDRVRGRLLEAGGGAAPDVLSMVVEHELMHQETLMYMAQRLSRRPISCGRTGCRRRCSAPGGRSPERRGCASRRDPPRSARARARSTSAGTTSSPPPRCGCPASRSTRPR